ncbi:MAG: putative transcriptional regulator [Acidimicrobiales bacterium]|jgi:predicted transcriptional regulator|tara:strand:- start:163 stop:462 length:300 start_codon:yes stop_codon:yes gene_type:complete
MPLTMPEPSIPSWTFLTNHAHVLIALSRNSDLRQKDIAYNVGITVGAVHRILAELEAAGYLTSERVGRRKHYEVNTKMPMRHPLEDQHTVHDLISSLEQ